MSMGWTVRCAGAGVYMCNKPTNRSGTARDSISRYCNKLSVVSRIFMTVASERVLSNHLFVPYKQKIRDHKMRLTIITAADKALCCILDKIVPP